MNAKSLCTALLLGTVTTVISTTAAWADDEFYCGSHIITEGLTKEQVIERCGEPSEKSFDQWVYKRGPDEFDMQLHFDGDDEVDRITELTERDD